MTIRVTQDDIRHGKRRLPHACPVALALGRAVTGSAYADLDMLVVYHPARGTLRFDTPSEVHEFMQAFDAGEKVIPFDFELQRL